MALGEQGVKTDSHPFMEVHDIEVPPLQPLVACVGRFCTSGAVVSWIAPSAGEVDELQSLPAVVLLPECLVSRRKRLLEIKQGDVVASVAQSVC